MSRVVEMKVLPSGKVRIHYFHRTEEGAATAPSGLTPDEEGKLRMGPVKGIIACSPATSKITSTTTKGVTRLVCHSDDPRAATCPQCAATEVYKAAMAEYASLLEQPPRKQPKEA